MNMNLRRRVMLGSVKPLFVFEYGNTALTNGTIQSKPVYLADGTKFSGGYLRIDQDSDRSSGTSVQTRGYVDIGGIEFTGYKKLNIECYTNVTSYDEYYTNFIAGYGEKAGSAESYYSELQHVPKTLEVLTFDISKVSGEKFIKILNNTTGIYTILVKNIWLE